MNPRLARFLTRLYPPAWRRRYGAEFEALLETERAGFGTPFEVAWSALAERIHPTQEGVKEQWFAVACSESWFAVEVGSQRQ